jgi:hypothetical protein
MDTITKSPNEKFPVYMGFSTDLITGESISSKTITCVNAATGLDSSAEIIESSTIISPDVQVVVQAGTEDDEHAIQCVVTTSYGNSYQRDVIVFVKIVIDDSFTKQPDDSFLFDVDYTRRLEMADVIASAAVSAIFEADGTGAGVYNTPSVISPKIGVPVFGGLSGYTYRFGVRGTTNMGYIYEKFIRMNVREY